MESTEYEIGNGTGQLLVRELQGKIENDGKRQIKIEKGRES